MRKVILTLTILLGLVAASFGQITSFTLATNDTLTNADTGIYTVPVRMLGQYCYSIECTSTKISGSNGLTTAYFQGSMDGTTYADLDTVIAASNTSATAFDYETTGTLYKYYRVYTLQSGTTVNKQNYTVIFWPTYKFSAVNIPGTTHTVCTNTVTYYYTNNGTDVASSPLSGIYTYQFYLVNDSVSGSGTSTFTVQGSNDNSNWVTISTNAFTADGTATVTNTTGTYYRYLKLNCAHTGTGVDHIGVWGVLQRKQ